MRWSSHSPISQLEGVDPELCVTHGGLSWMSRQLAARCRLSLDERLLTLVSCPGLFFPLLFSPPPPPPIIVVL